MKYLVLFLTILLFFVGENVYGRLGGPPYFQYLIILFIYGVGLLLLVKKSYPKQFILFILFSLFYFFLRIVLLGREGVLWLSLLLFAAPILCYLYYSIYRNSPSIANITSLCVLGLYFLECFISLTERLMGSLLFGWSTSGDGIIMELGEKNEFRSTALLGHPLQNALVVSTIMSFILFSQMKLATKLSLWFLGYLAVMCFNTRSSMVGNVVILGVFVFSKILSSKGKRKARYIMIGLFLSVVISYLLFNSSLGGRLLEMGLVDDTSAQARIDTWALFDYFSLDSFLWGHTSKESSDLLYVASLMRTENFWIDWLLHFGIVTLVVYLFLMFNLLKALYNNYESLSKWITCLTFWLIASTNNSLTVSYVPMLIYLLSIIVFSPKNIKYMPQILYK